MARRPALRRNVADLEAITPHARAGADFVLIGRAWVYALAGGGEAGVAHALKLIEAEMRVAMALTGVTSIAAIDGSIIAD